VAGGIHVLSTVRPAGSGEALGRAELDDGAPPARHSAFPRSSAAWTIDAAMVRGALPRV